MKLTPYLNFPGNAEEAFTHYRSVFGGDFAGIIRFEDMGDPERTPEHVRRQVAHIALPLGDGAMLMASDAPEGMGTPLTQGNNVYVMLEPDSAEEAERLFGALSDGGHVEMALQKTDWAERHGSCTDRFGVHWMLNYTGDVQYTLPQEEAPKGAGRA